MNNNDFLNAITASFEAYLQKGTSRSTAKLKPLHGAIAADLAQRLPDHKIISQGYKTDKEAAITGRYFSKKVDIAILKNGVPCAGVAVKFIMRNYSQNSVNYFENMLGETANIRCDRKPYFQIFIIFDKLPYYTKNGDLKKWESFTEHNIHKYIALSLDNTDLYFHTPNKTLIYVIHIPDNDQIKTLNSYINYYSSLHPDITISQNQYSGFGDSVILNDYEEFAKKLYHTVEAL